MSKQGKWASILIMELAPSAPTWTRVSKPKNRRERFFIKTFCLPFWSRSRMSRRLVGKPVSRGYWIVIGCNAGQGSNRIFPNCPFCHQPAPPSSTEGQNTEWIFHHRKSIQKEENTMGGDTNTFYSDEVTKVQRVGESLAVHSHLSKYQSRFMKYFRILIFDLQRDIFTRWWYSCRQDDHWST